LGHWMELSIVGKNEASPILDNTCHSNILSKTQKVLQPSQVLSYAYYESMQLIV